MKKGWKQKRHTRKSSTGKVFKAGSKKFKLKWKDEDGNIKTTVVHDTSLESLKKHMKEKLKKKNVKVRFITHKK